MAILGGNKQANETPTTPVKATAPATAPAPTAKRGAKTGVTRKPLELDLGGLVVTVVTDPQEMAKARRTRGERSADQKRLDAMVETAWQNWKKAGSPSEWPKMPGVKVQIAESKYDTLVSGIRKAGQFYDLKVRFGAPKKLGDGVVECVFVVTDRPAKDDDNDSED